jgi:oligogalacturonide lyase
MISRLPLRLAAFALFGLSSILHAQTGRRIAPEKKTVIDPVTGTPLTFLTSTPAGDSKIYQTHPDWTSDGQWVVFRSNRARGQAFAVNEASGDIVQLTDQGYLGMLCLSRRQMKLYFMRDVGRAAADTVTGAPPPAGIGDNDDQTRRAMAAAARANHPRGPFEIVELDLARLFSDSLSGRVQPSATYERICGTTPDGMQASGNMGLDANEDYAYFGINGAALASRLPPGTALAPTFGPRNMGAGPSGLASMNLKTGEVKIVTVVPFQIGHVQTNPWMPREIVFCWETGGKAPQRTWTVMADGSGLRPLYPEAGYEWITHEAVITKDEVAIAIIGHRKVGVPATDPWGPSGTTEHPTGLGIVNLRTREMRIIGQIPMGNPGRSVWHVNGSADGRWAVADDFLYRLWLIDRHTGEMIMLADMGHKTTAADHIHPTFSADGTKIEVQTAMIAPDNHTLNICVVPVPKSWLARTYSDRAPQ